MSCFIDWAGSKQQECGQLWWKVKKYFVGETSGWASWTSCTYQAAFSERAQVKYVTRVKVPVVL